MSEALIARWSRLEREYRSTIADLLAALKRHSDCAEAHATGGICHEDDHLEMVRQTDAAIARAAPTEPSPEPRHSPYCESVLRPPRMCDCAASGPPVVEPRPASEEGLIEHEFEWPPGLAGSRLPWADRCARYMGGDSNAPWTYCNQPRSRHRPSNSLSGKPSTPPESER